MSKILIVDDHLCARQLLTAELTLEGYHLASSGDAESAKGRLLSFRPDVVLLDLYLDGSEAFGLFDDIKKQHPHLPIIIFTAYDGYIDHPRLSQADGYVIKSIDLGELKQKVADVLKRKAAREEKVEAKSYLPKFGCLVHSL
jgi:two-component system response regulator (stage 0 sporulation protein F)